MSKVAVSKSSANVFADIGTPDAKEHVVKAALVTSIARSIASQNLTQSEAAKRMACRSRMFPGCSRAGSAPSRSSV
jgi:predicted XRE-type DNA-binding protein